MDYTAIYQRNFKKEDFQAAARVLTIKSSELDEFPGRDGSTKKERKVKLFFVEDERAIVLNKTRYEDVCAIAGSGDSDKWPGVKVEAYYDPTVRNPNGPRGGIGIRRPSA